MLIPSNYNFLCRRFIYSYRLVSFSLRNEDYCECPHFLPLDVHCSYPVPKPFVVTPLDRFNVLPLLPLPSLPPSEQ
jgi:hypothetical protein